MSTLMVSHGVYSLFLWPPTQWKILRFPFPPMDIYVHIFPLLSSFIVFCCSEFYFLKGWYFGLVEEWPFLVSWTHMVGNLGWSLSWPIGKSWKNFVRQDLNLVEERKVQGGTIIELRKDRGWAKKPEPASMSSSCGEGGGLRGYHQVYCTCRQAGLVLVARGT